MRKLLLGYVMLALTALVVLAGGSAMIEMVYHLQLNEAMGPELTFLGVHLNAKDSLSWAGASVVMLFGLGWFEFFRRRFALVWHEIHDSIQHQIKAKEAS
jgi:branched-chain amino acid transport system permease protein